VWGGERLMGWASYSDYVAENRPNPLTLHPSAGTLRKTPVNRV